VFSRLVFSVALSLALARPELAHSRVFDPIAFTLANGMQVVVVENRRAPIVTHMVWYRAGAADEPAGKSGIAHFLEHLMFKATRTLAPGEFSRNVARQGGRDNAFTSWDYTGYVQTVAADRLELVMRMEADRMVNLVLTDDTVLPERDVILEERRQVVDNVPSSRLREQAMAALFLNHPYGRPIIGWEHEMRGLTRADAVAWYERWYAPNNAVVIVTGDVSAADVRVLAERHYGSIAAKTLPPRVRPAEPPPQAARRVTLRDERVRQPGWSRSYLAPSLNAGETKHAYPLQVLSDILGGETGRFYRKLVTEKRVAFDAGAGYSPDSFDLSIFSVWGSPRDGTSPEQLERAIDEVLAELLRDGVTPDEVARAKTRMDAAAVLVRDELGNAPRIIGVSLMAGQTLDELEAWPARIQAVDSAAVIDAARAVLREERSVTSLLLGKTP
jgi:zinc protease